MHFAPILDETLKVTRRMGIPRAKVVARDWQDWQDCCDVIFFLAL